jgi:hypothetical protein
MTSWKLEAETCWGFSRGEIDVRSRWSNVVFFFSILLLQSIVLIG